MIAADDLDPEKLIGRKVAFKDDPEHHACWHYRVGLKTGVVRRLAHSLAHKVELLGEVPEEVLDPALDVPRLWVKADPCPAFARGCETAVEKECLLLAEPTP